MLQENLKTIKEQAEEFFKQTGFTAEVEQVLEQEKNTVAVNIKVQDPQVLIGEGGQTLAEIQHLLRAVLKRKITEPFFLNLDINGYKQKKYEYLRELARLMADEAVLTRKEKQLLPMPAHERRIIHLELAERQDVVTESSGQGQDRRIVIKPA